MWKNIASSLTLPGLDAPESYLKAPSSAGKQEKSPKDKARNAFKHIRKSMTIVFRNFYTFENDIKESIDSILNVIPNIAIVVFLEGIPYPPLVYERNLTAKNEEQTVRFVNLGFDIMKPHQELNPLSAIHTKYALFMPDSVRLSSKNLLQKILREINTNSWDGQAKPQAKDATATGADEIVRRMIIVPFAGNIKSFVGCTLVQMDLPNWTILYEAVNTTSDKCDLVSYLTN